MLGFGKKKTRPDPLDRYELPTFPSAVMALLNKLRDPEIPTNELAADLEIDPGLHVRVLKTVNSAAFGLSHKVSNIRHAVNLLGRGRLESLVLSVAVKDSLSRDNAPPWLDMQQFWATACYRAALARCLAARLHPNLQSDVFTICLLQDMAIPLLANREKIRYRDLYLSWLGDDDFDLIEQERAVFGVDHASLGAKMAENWKFPASLVESIRHHHGQNCSELIPVSVQVAALIKGDPETDRSEHLIDMAIQRFGLPGDLLVEQVEIARSESLELTAALS